MQLHGLALYLTKSASNQPVEDYIKKTKSLQAQAEFDKLRSSNQAPKTHQPKPIKNVYGGETKPYSRPIPKTTRPTGPVPKPTAIAKPKPSSIELGRGMKGGSPKITGTPQATPKFSTPELYRLLTAKGGIPLGATKIPSSQGAALKGGGGGPKGGAGRIGGNLAMMLALPNTQIEQSGNTPVGQYYEEPEFHQYEVPGEFDQRLDMSRPGSYDSGGTKPIRMVPRVIEKPNPKYRSGWDRLWHGKAIGGGPQI